MDTHDRRSQDRRSQTAPGRRDGPDRQAAPGRRDGPDRQAAQAGKRYTRQPPADECNSGPRVRANVTSEKYRRTNVTLARVRRAIVTPNRRRRSNVTVARALNRPGPREPSDFSPRSRPRGDHRDSARPAAAELVADPGSAQRVARLAAAQRGSVHRDQFLTAGVSRHTVERRTRIGELHRMHRGVYVVGHLARAPMAEEWAAVLACGEQAFVSHRSAAHLWSIAPESPPAVDVTLVGRRCRPKDGVRIHLTASIDPRDLRRTDGLLLTSPARTLVDLAARGSEAELRRHLRRREYWDLWRKASSRRRSLEPVGDGASRRCARCCPPRASPGSPARRRSGECSSWFERPACPSRWSIEM